MQPLAQILQVRLLQTVQEAFTMKTVPPRAQVPPVRALCLDAREFDLPHPQSPQVWREARRQIYPRVGQQLHAPYAMPSYDGCPAGPVLTGTVRWVLCAAWAFARLLPDPRPDQAGRPVRCAGFPIPLRLRSVHLELCHPNRDVDLYAP